MPLVGAAKAAAALLFLSCIAASGPQAADFVAAAEFAASIGDGEAPPGSLAEPAIVTGSEDLDLPLQEYRRLRSACELNRLIRIRGRSEVGMEWRCGPLNGRWNDVYVIAGGRVVRVIANVPLLVTAPDGRERP